MSVEVRNKSLDQPDWQRRVAAAAMTVVALAGCSNQAPPDRESAPGAASPTFTPESPVPASQAPSPEILVPKDCSFRYVQPGLNLSQENVTDLDEDLARMTKLYQGGDKVGLRDIAGVGRIIKDSYQDPLYAQAISQARESIASGQSLSAEELLALPVTTPSTCDANHIEKSASENQIKQTVSLSQSLVRKLGERLGDRASSLTKRAYNTLQREVEELRRKADEAERQPSK